MGRNFVVIGRNTVCNAARIHVKLPPYKFLGREFIPFDTGFSQQPKV